MKLSIPHPARRHGASRGLRLRSLMVALLAAGFASPGLAQGLPSGLPTSTDNVTWSVNGAGDVMTIEQSAQRAIADWGSFSIGSGSTVNVRQPSSSAVLLNRVIGIDGNLETSVINGALNANGHVYLINPAGIVFGEGAQVNVGGILASTLDLAGATMQERNNRFLDGGPLTFEADGASSGIWVESGAEIRAHGDNGAGGMVVLMGEGVTNEGTISAPGGTVALGAGGRITLDPVGDGLTTLRINDPSLSDATGIFNGEEGQIDADGGRIQLVARSIYGAFIEQQGLVRAQRIAARGGEITLDAGDGMVELTGGTLDASGEGVDNGGSIQVLGGDLTLGGNLLATGANAGGHIETSGTTFRMNPDFQVDTSATNGRAGTWLLDPQDLTIASGTPVGALNVLYDQTINDTLNSGTSVTVATPAGGTGNGDVTFENDVHIQRMTPGAPVTFTVEALGNITAGAGVEIESEPTTGGALNVALNAGQGISFGGRISSNGGDIALRGNGASNAAGVGMTGGAGLEINSTDQGSGQGDGRIEIRGHATGFDGAVGVDLQDGVTVISGQGDMDIAGTVDGTGVGVRMATASLQSSSGTIRVFGRSGAAQTDQAGVSVGFGSRIATTAGGDVLIHGRVNVLDGGLAGVAASDGAIIDATGDIDLAGWATEGAPGVMLAALQGSLGPAVTSTGNVTLRAGNDGASDALVIGPAATVHAGGMLNLRPGEVSTSGVAADRLGDAVTLGTDGNGFSVSVDELSRLSAGDAIVLGSAVHAGVITVDDSISLAGSLTLQNEGAGSGGIALQAPVAVSGTLGLLSAGDVVQAAPVAASQVLARSSGGDVLLNNPGNDATTVSGGAPSGRFTWVDANAVALAPVAATGAQVAINVPQAVNPGTLSAGNLLVQTLSGDLTLSMPLTSSAGADLVAAGLFQNPGAGSAGGAPWRVWASTWAGESRGGMSGSGALPNLYNCPYGGPCGVSIPSGDNHFIYAAQPTATVDIDDVSRALGWPNPPLTYGISGLILGDGGAAVTGSIATTAGLLSAMGNYPITGSFTSPAGYAVTVNPGILRITEFVQPPVGQVPTLGLPGSSAIYEENLGGAPICLASEPLAGDGQLADGDMLAREWSRVRTRPQLTNCLRSSRREACSDF